jgi:hypothetical protein
LAQLAFAFRGELSQEQFIRFRKLLDQLAK